MQYFFFHKKTLYATTDALEFAGKTSENIRVGVHQKSKALASCKIAELGKSNYFKWDNMSNGWRECIEKRFGNPYHFIGQEPILKMVVADAKV